MCKDRIFIEDNTVIIRELRDRDLDVLAAMRNDMQIYRYEPTFLEELSGTPEEALRAIRNMDLNEDRQCILGIYEKSDPDVLAGLAELYDYKHSGKVISIGYRLRPECWGKGIGTACVRALLDFIHENTEVTLVTAHVIPDNGASARVLLKNGFEYLLTKTEDWGHGGPTVADVYTLDR